MECSRLDMKQIPINIKLSKVCENMINKISLLQFCKLKNYLIDNQYIMNLNCIKLDFV
jgi:hypothetical protein